jgi:hypothetical protein
MAAHKILRGASAQPRSRLQAPEASAYAARELDLGSGGIQRRQDAAEEPIYRGGERRGRGRTIGVSDAGRGKAELRA